MTDVAEQLNARGRDTLIDTIGVRFREVTDERVVVELDFHPEVQQVTGVFHAGALLPLAGPAATAVCVQAINPTGNPDSARFPLTIQVSATLIRSTNQKSVTAEARLLHRGRTTLAAQAEVHDERGRLLAQVTTTHVVHSGACACEPPCRPSVHRRAGG